MKIDVTKEDIFYGERRNTCKCPVARAIRRVTNSYVRVGDNTIIIGDMELYDRAFPGEVKMFVSRFDNGRLVEPFTFELNYTIPDKTETFNLPHTD